VSGSWPTASKSESVASTLVRQASRAPSRPFDVLASPSSNRDGQRVADCNTGLSLEEIVEQTQQRGLKDWTGVEQKKCSVHATILKDHGFTKLSPGVFALTCLAHPHATSTNSVNASRGLLKRGEAGASAAAVTAPCGVMTPVAMHRKLVEGSAAKRARRLAGSLVYTRTYEALGEPLPAGRMPTVLGGGYGGGALEKAAHARA
jgi:hypothetical protein